MSGKRATRLPQLDPDRPYTRAPGESVAAFAAFQAYLTLGPDRTMTAVAERLQTTIPALKGHSHRWAWVHRCEAYDRDHLADWEQRRTAIRNEVEEQLVSMLRGIAAESSPLGTTDTLEPKERAVVFDRAVGRLAKILGLEQPTTQVNVSTTVAFTSLDAMTATQLVEIAEHTLGDSHPEAFTALCDALLALEQSTPAQRRTVIGQLG